jgi:hypothetical protein
MKIPFLFLLSLFLFACEPAVKKDHKIPVYAWTSGPREASDQEIRKAFDFYKEKGIDGLMYNGGQKPETYSRVGKIAKAAGLAFHAWIPTMVQAKQDALKEGMNDWGDYYLHAPKICVLKLSNIMALINSKPEHQKQMAELAFEISALTKELKKL